MIKQEIPKDYVKAELSHALIKHTSIPHKVIVTDWLWRNKHAEAIETVVIPNLPEFVYRDKTIAAYHKRLNQD